MITKAQVKHIRSLEQKKNRIENGQIVVEGEKMCNELIEAGWSIEAIYTTPLFKGTIPTQLADKHSPIAVSYMEQMTHLQHASPVLALVAIPPQPNLQMHGVSLLLDDIQDPGNMGSIIRIADWFGINQIIASPTSVDCYNSKVIQATMGSIFRIPVYYANLAEIIQQHAHLPCYAAVLGGESIRQVPSIKEGLIIIGNESRGISSELLSMQIHQITIPAKGKAESLNAAIATGIICYQLLS